jgi:hypothetical protein
MATYLAALTLCEADMQYGTYGKLHDEYSLDRLSLESQHGKQWVHLPEKITGALDGAERTASLEWSDRFAEPQWNAATALVGTPAPTLAAAVFKHSLIQREETPQWTDLPFDCMDVLAADFARLADNPANAAWQAAREAEQAARDAAQRFYDENVKPANEAHEAGTASVADVTAQEDAYAAYSDEHLTVTKAMMATPAPSVSAAIHKLRVGLRDWFFDGSDQGCRALAQVASDLARLTGRHDYAGATSICCLAHREQRQHRHQPQPRPSARRHPARMVGSGIGSALRRPCKHSRPCRSSGQGPRIPARNPCGTARVIPCMGKGATLMATIHTLGRPSGLPLSLLSQAIHRLSRCELEDLAQSLIDHLDAMDGDPDLEDDDPAGNAMKTA